MRNKKLLMLSVIICLILALILSPFMAGCAKPTPPTPPPTPPPAPPTPPPPTGPTGTLTVAMPTLHEETFLPWNGGFARVFYLNPIYETLVYIDPETLKLVPGLATKWEMTPDGKTWTFWIREGIQFQEGWGEVTAEDIKYSIERYIAPDSIVGPSSPLRAEIAKVEAPEKYKVIVSLKEPDVELDRGYFSNGGAVQIVCKKYIETAGDKEANTHPIGTGPYTLVQHRRGVSIMLEAIPGVEKHWRVKPAFKSIIFLAVPEEATRVAMLRRGEADLGPISYDSVDSVKAAGLNIVSVPYSWTPVIRLGGIVEAKPARYNPKNPWADVRVRQALNYAVDKDAIAKNIFRGVASLAGVDSPCREWLTIKPYPYDVAKAKQLLAEAGYSAGFDITLKTFTTTPGAELPVIGQAVAMYWQAIGLNVKVVPVDYPSLRAEWTTDKALNYCWTHRGQAFTTSMQSLNASILSTSAFCTYGTAKTDSMLKAIKEELDSKKREALIIELGQLVRDEAGAVFLVFANEAYGASKQVGKWPTLSVAAVNIDLITRP